MAKKRKWKNIFYLDVYLMANSGASQNAIAKSLGVSISIFKIWMERRKTLRDCFRRGREGLAKTKYNEDFIEYVYKNLPPKLRRTWQRLERWDAVDYHPSKKGHALKMRNLLLKQTKMQRQHLFLHALVNSSFNISEALRQTHLTYDMYRRWIERDKYFRDLLDQMNFHKKNFIEGSLFRLISNGSEQATIFAARNLLKDRGFEDKKSVEVSGRVDHAHFDIMEILKNVSTEARKEFLHAIRKQEQGALVDKPKPNITVTKVTQRMGLDDEDTIEAEEVDGD